MKSIKVSLLSVLFVFFLSSCVTTALYGNTFEEQSPDVYSLKVYWGGPPPGFQDFKDIIDTVDKRLDVEAKSFISTSNLYTTYEIVEREQHGSAFEYQVKFIK